jgi:hypothetical protein
MHGEKGAELQTWVLVGSLSTVLNWSAALNPTDILTVIITIYIYDDLKNNYPQ